MDISAQTLSLKKTHDPIAPPNNPASAARSEGRRGVVAPTWWRIGCGEFQAERKLSAPTVIKEGDIFRVGLTRLRLGGAKNDRYMAGGAVVARGK